MNSYKVFLIILLITVIVIVILYELFKNKPLFCTDSKVELDFNTPDNNVEKLEPAVDNTNKFDQNNKNNARICLFYTRFIIKMECDPEFGASGWKQYETPLHIEKIIRNPSNNEPLALIARSGDKILIAWKGTNTLYDASFDIDEFYTHYKGMNIHSGFYEYFKMVQPQIMNYIENNDGNGKSAIKYIFSSGHSLGAAVSTLSSYIYSDYYRDTTTKEFFNYSSASPRVGDSKFVANYNNKDIHTVLLVNLFDKIPDEPSIPSFYHVDTLGKRGFAVFFGNGTSYVANHAPSLYYNNINNAELIEYNQ